MQQVREVAAKRRERALRMSATMSLAQIGKRLGISRQRAHQLIVKQRKMEKEVNE